MAEEETWLIAKYAGGPNSSIRPIRSNKDPTLPKLLELGFKVKDYDEFYYSVIPLEGWTLSRKGYNPQEVSIKNEEGKTKTTLNFPKYKPSLYLRRSELIKHLESLAPADTDPPILMNGDGQGDLIVEPNYGFYSCGTEDFFTETYEGQPLIIINIQ